MTERRPLPSVPDDEVDVVVVGGGLAGLASARALSRLGASVLVLEARERVGGRTLTRAIGQGAFDLGAQWIGPTQDRLRQLARDLSVPLFPTFTQGKKVLERDGKVSTYRRSIPSLPLLQLLELHKTIRRLDKLARGVPRFNPAAARRAGRLDGMSLETWKRDHVRGAGVRELLDSAVRVVFGAEPAELSLLYFLFYLHAAGGLRRLIEVKDGAQQDRFVPGAQELARGLAAELGDRVVLEAPVERIAQDQDGLVVSSARGPVRARYALVCVPPALAARIEYSPALPAVRDQLTQRAPMGSLVKCVLTYERPFWRERGFSGEAVATRGPISAVFDNSSHDNAQPALVAFVAAREARRWSGRSEVDRRRVVTAPLARWFGDEAARPVEMVACDWGAKTWTRGCPVGVLPPGTLTTLGSALRRPVGRIHWAGTETATEWCGYLEGALESSERAVAELLERL